MAEDIILTATSFRKLQQELEYLKTVKRAEISEALRRARSYGDLSENFEYHAARREQGILNGRIKEMEKTLEIARVVPDPEGGSDEIGLGTIVTLHDTALDEEWEITLTDRVHANPIEDRISIESPVGQALLGRKAGDEVEVETPGGTDVYRVLSIRHE
jgi:transcription elongation factor GreA